MTAPRRFYGGRSRCCCTGSYGHASATSTEAARRKPPLLGYSTCRFPVSQSVGAIGCEGTTEEWGWLGNAGVVEAVMQRQISERQGRAHGHDGGSKGSGQYLPEGELDG